MSKKILFLFCFSNFWWSYSPGLKISKFWWDVFLSYLYGLSSTKYIFWFIYTFSTYESIAWLSPSVINFFPISEFSYELIRFLLHSSVIKSDNKIGKFPYKDMECRLTRPMISNPNTWSKFWVSMYFSLFRIFLVSSGVNLTISGVF